MSNIKVLLKAIKDDVLDFNFRELKKAILGVESTVENTVITTITNNYPAASETVNHLAADVTANSTTLRDSGLYFDVISNKYYRFVFRAVASTASGGVTLRIAVTFPTSTYFTATQRTPIAAAGGMSSAGESQGFIQTSGVAWFPTASPNTNEKYIIEVTGVMLPTVTGRVMLQFANEIGVTVVTLHKGSVVEALQYG